MLFHVLPIDPTCGIDTLACAHKATQNASGAGDVEDVVVMPSPQEDGSDQCLATSETRINQLSKWQEAVKSSNQLVQQISKP